MLAKQLQIYIISYTIRNRKIQIRTFFDKWKIFIPVNRKSINILVVLKYMSGSVALMHIEVDD
ncbi:hypothetical protein D3C86_2080380 [compost metagenome]